MSASRHRQHRLARFPTPPAHRSSSHRLWSRPERRQNLEKNCGVKKFGRAGRKRRQYVFEISKVSIAI